MCCTRYDTILTYGSMRSLFLRCHELITLSTWQGTNFGNTSRIKTTNLESSDNIALLLKSCVRILNGTSNICFPILNAFNSINVANIFLRQRAAFILSPPTRYSGIGFPVFFLQKAPGRIYLYILQQCIPNSPNPHLLLWWSLVTTFLLLTHACLIIPKGDP